MYSNGCSHSGGQVGIAGFKENYPVDRAGGDEEEKEHEVEASLEETGWV